MDKRQPYVTYVQGNCNIIIATPHGGYDVLENAPVRQNGCYDVNISACDYKENCSSPRLRNKCRVSVNQDTYTREIAEMISTNMEQSHGLKPHIVHMNIHRRFVDVNRPKDQGTNGNAISEGAWEQFHKTVQQVRNKLQIGLYIDLHGHRHPHGILELGYRVWAKDLNTHNFSAQDTSIRNLASRVNVDTCLGDLIWGERGFGGILQEKGFSCMPSPEYPTPGSMRYFRGGYNTEQYGSISGGGVDAIQIEMPEWVRNQENGTMIAQMLADTIVEYKENYY